MLKLGLYKNEQSGNLTTPRSGLTEEQVKALQDLKPGDRLIIYMNRDKRYETTPDANLKQLVSKKETNNDF